MGRKCHCESEHWRCDRPDPRPHVSATNPEPHKKCHRQPGGCDESGHGDVQVTDVVVQQRGAELSDLVLANINFAVPDSEFEETVGEVTNEEDHRVADETEGRESHEPRPDPKIGIGSFGQSKVRTGRRHLSYLSSIAGSCVPLSMAMPIPPR